MQAAAGPTEPQGKPRVTGGAWAEYPSLLVARDQVPTFVHGDGLQLKRSADGQEYRAARVSQRPATSTPPAAFPADRLTRCVLRLCSTVCRSG